MTTPKRFQWLHSVVGQLGSPSQPPDMAFMLSSTKFQSLSASKTSRRLDMCSFADDKPKVRAKLFADHTLTSKENIDENISLENVSEISRVKFEEIISRYPQLQSLLKPSYLNSMPLEELPVHEQGQSSRSLLQKKKCNQEHLLRKQEKELAVLNALFIETKQEFKDFQLLFQKDLMELAKGIEKVVEEKGKLYDMVQDLKGNIRVYCRVKPSENKGVIDYIGNDWSLYVVDPSKPNQDARKKFQFNQVFGPTATQDDVFKETKALIRAVMDGYNVCIFAYGQTGSGKTYTMSGPPGRSANELGINFLALNDLFLLRDKRKDTMKYEIHVQMVEIYNEQVRDLLAENSSSTKLDIRTCSDGLSLPDATMLAVNSTEDVLQLMEAGEMNRAVSSTSKNNRSSRSHSILMVHVGGKDTSGGTFRSCLHLVDLAGSERVDKSDVTGDRLKEAQYINKSLSSLGDVISALAQKKKNSHIPYRNSKLTLLLQDSLGGKAKTLMLAHLSPEEDSFGETITTLKFAQRVSTVELGTAHAHKDTREVIPVDSRTNAKRNSMGTIGKLINTSEKKRKDNTPADPRSSLGVANKRPRTSSIGAKPIENGVTGTGNAKTPLLMRSASKISKKWV